MQYREPPSIELGSFELGVGAAAAKAIAQLPRGGRVLSRCAGLAPYSVGALGSVGLVLTTLAALFVATSAEDVSSVAPAVPIVCALSLSLAVVLRAADRFPSPPTRSGADVARDARRLLRKWTRLAGRAERAPNRFGARRNVALRRSLLLALDPDVGRWVPADLVGRVELLCARSLAAQAGRDWIARDEVRDCVRELVVSAASHLDDASPALENLDAIDRAPSRRRAPAAGRASQGVHPNVRLPGSAPADADAEQEAAAELGETRSTGRMKTAIIA